MDRYQIGITLALQIMPLPTAEIVFPWLVNAFLKPLFGPTNIAVGPFALGQKHVIEVTDCRLVLSRTVDLRAIAEAHTDSHDRHDRHPADSDQRGQKSLGRVDGDQLDSGGSDVVLLDLLAFPARSNP